MFDNGKVRRGLVAAVVAMTGVVATAAPSVADHPLPDVVADLGGPLHAEMYPSGIEVAPDGTIVVADTGNNQIVKYDQSGNEIWRVGAPGTDDGEFLRPRDVSVSSNGTIFVVDTESQRLIRLDANGNWLGVIDTPAVNFLGGTFKNDKFYLADIARKVRVFDVAGNELQVITEQPGTPCDDLFDSRDATADSAGNIYVATYRFNEINVFSPTGECLYAFGTQGTANGQFRTPYGIATAVDPFTGREMVYVADALNNRVQVFELDGTYYGKMGSSATTTTLRRVAVATDGSGDVWVADLWGWRIRRFDRTSTGWTLAQTIGATMPPTTDDNVFHENRGLAVDASGVINVMDSVHHRLVRMNQDGTIVNTCGTRGDGQNQYNWPRDVDIDETTGYIWIADTKKNRLQAIQPNCTFVAARGANATAAKEPDRFTWVRSIAIRQSDRTLWATDTQNHRVTVWDLATNNGTNIGVGWGTGNPGAGTNQLNRPMGIAVDEATGHVFIADTINDRIVELSADAGATNVQLVRTISGIGLNNPEAIEIGPDGRIWIADTGDSEIVVLHPDGTVAGTFGAAQGLDSPAGITLDADGDVFVSDSFNDRVLILSTDPAWEPPPTDQANPDATVSAPTPGQTLTSSPIAFSGTATDDMHVTNVRLAFRNRDTQAWWNGTSWQAGIFNFEATLTAPGATSTGWSYQWAPPAFGNYAVQVSAVDAAGKTDQSKPYVQFQYASAGDNANPNGLLTVPTANQVFPSSPIGLSGTATDDVSVAAVRLQLRRLSPAGYWNGSTWQSTATEVNATLANPGATSTGWSYSLPVTTSGQYEVRVTAVDGVGKTDPTRPLVRFRYTPPTVDTTVPNGTLTAPASGQVYTSTPIAMSGAATDNVGVNQVRLVIRRTSDQAYWTGSAWQAGSAQVLATLGTPGGTSTNWTYSFTPPAAGTFSVQVTAADAAGNVDPTKPFRQFSLSFTDTTAPNGLLTTPNANGQAFSSIPIGIAGTASDNIGVAAVHLTIRRTSDQAYWNGSAWQVGATTVDATLGTPGGTSTSWTYAFSPPASGTFSVQVTAADAAGNVDPTKPFRQFTLT